MGFYIESDPNRGADGGKDILVSEQIEGMVGNYRVKWLVSCKHNAKSGVAVNEKIELNILERVNGFGAEGFIGVYSTIASSGLTNRLNQLKDTGAIKDYKIFDHKLIENYLINIGFSNLLMRYFPNGYKQVKPLHILFDKYYPLNCDVCGQDLLHEMYKNSLNGIIGYVGKQTNSYFIEDIYIACKGECDRQLENKWLNKGIATAWHELKDLSNPLLYLKYLMSTINNIRSGEWKYTNEAFEKEKFILMKLGQKVFQEMNEEDRKRSELLAEFQFMF
jgi:hypothetical protein